MRIYNEEIGEWICNNCGQIWRGSTPVVEPAGPVYAVVTCGDCGEPSGQRIFGFMPRRGDKSPCWQWQSEGF